jgi:hypothetical protein
MNRRFVAPWFLGGFAMAVLLLLVVMLPMALAGCGGDGTDQAAADAATTISAEEETPETTAPPAADLDTEQYTNEEHGFSFDYPAAWEIKDDLTEQTSAGGNSIFSIGAFDPDGTVANDTLLDGVVVNLYQLNVQVDDSNLADIRAEMEGMLAGMESSQEGLSTIAPLEDIKVGSLPGFKVTYAFPQEGVPLVSTLYFLFQDDVEYQVIVQSAEELWEDLQPNFDTVVKSFAVQG